MAFQRGQSGNAAGRPKDKTPATAIRKAIAADMPEIIQTLVLLAKGGDVGAARALLDRVCPPLKAVTPTVSVPVTGDASLLERANSIIDETMQGNLSPDIATQLMGALANLGKIIESTELETRLENLERLLEKRA